MINGYGLLNLFLLNREQGQGRDSGGMPPLVFHKKRYSPW